MKNVIFALCFLIYLFDNQVFGQDSWLVGLSNYPRQGQVYRSNLDGSNLVTTHQFSRGFMAEKTNLIKVGLKLFGITSSGGYYDKGALFSYDTRSGKYTTLYMFDSASGANPTHQLHYANGKLWGVTKNGGAANMGVAFKMDTSGQNYQIIKEFASIASNPSTGITYYRGDLYGWAYDKLYKISTSTNALSILYQQSTFWGEGAPRVFNNKIIGLARTSVGEYASFSLGLDGSGFTKSAFASSGSSLLTSELSLIKDRLWTTVTPYSDNGFDQVFYSFDTLAFGSQQHIFPRYKNKSQGKFLLRYKDKILVAETANSSHGGAIVSLDGDVNKWMSPSSIKADTLYTFDRGAFTSQPVSLLYANDTIWGLGNGGGDGFSGELFRFDPSQPVSYFRYTKVREIGNENGVDPRCALLQVGDRLWGTTLVGGAHAFGTIFSTDLYGTNYKKVSDFSSDKAQLGYRAAGGLCEAGNYLYGVNNLGGSMNDGTIYRIDPVSEQVSKVFDFSAALGSSPLGDLVVSNGKLYGITAYGGVNSKGTFYSIHPDGSGHQVLQHFADSSGCVPYNTPRLFNNKWWGMTNQGGKLGYGVIYSMDADGKNYKVEYHFDETSGKSPWQDLVVANNLLYGTASEGGANGTGTLFSIHPSTKEFKVLANFDNKTIGGYPFSRLAHHNGILYGNTYSGGPNQKGSLYAFNIGSNEIKVLSAFAFPMMAGYTFASPTVVSGKALPTDLAPSVEQVISSLAVSPNPSNDGFKINLGQSEIRVVDLLGHELIRRRVTSNETFGENLQPGLYLLQVEQEGRMETKLIEKK